MAARRPRVAKKVPRKVAPKAAPRPKAKAELAKRARPLRRPKGFEPEPVSDRGYLAPAEPEPVEASLLGIAQDAVIILRHELRAKAELAVSRPGWMSMGDCIALLRLTTELGEAAKRGQDGGHANYDRLSPAEREQLAALLLKVDYA